MTLLNRIIGRVNIIHLRYRTCVEYDTMVGCYAITPQGFEHRSDVPDRNAPQIVIVTGAGVISKNKDEITGNLIKRLDKDTFLVREDKDGMLSFVRREQLAGIPYKSIITIPAAQFSVEPILDIWNTEVTLQKILRFTESGNILSRTLLAKVKLPILTLSLVVLSANFYLVHKTRDRFVENQAVLSVLKQKNLPETANHSIGFACEKIHCALLVDRIGASTPKAITLTAISIQPVTKKIETGKELQLDRNLVVIAGYAENTAGITDFVNNLNSCPVATELILSSIERNADKQLISFKITLKL